MSGLLAPETRDGHRHRAAVGHLPREEAVAAVAAHIDAFWDPRMKRALAALVAEKDDSLDPLLVSAVRSR
jgi:formate dehydrogenase subunit delta